MTVAAYMSTQVLALLLAYPVVALLVASYSCSGSGSCCLFTFSAACWFSSSLRLLLLFLFGSLLLCMQRGSQALRWKPMKGCVALHVKVLISLPVPI